MHFVTNALKYRHLRFRIIVVAGCSADARCSGALQEDWRNEVMSARKSVVRFLAHTLMVVGAIFVVTVLLAAMIELNHRRTIPPRQQAVEFRNLFPISF